MTDFQLDTSGAVRIPSGKEPASDFLWRWHNLDPFTQGYVEALFMSMPVLIDKAGPTLLEQPGFRDIAPATLARIMVDCAAVAIILGNRRGDGVSFWVSRQQGKQRDFPPLTVALNDAGQVVIA